ncbi:MAG: hypothetical protein VB957_03245 [Pseudomonadales bacterium]|jgi:hypothetical protein
MLEVLANLAEILAGLAIVFSVVRLWPALGKHADIGRRKRIKNLSDLEPIREG